MSDATGTTPDEGSKPAGRPKNTQLIVAGIVVVLVLIAAIAGIALTGGDDSESAKTGPSGEKIYQVELGEMYVKPASISVKSGEHVVLEVTNKGEGDHDLKLDGTKGTDFLGPNEKATADFGVITASTQAWCTVPEHKKLGMVMDIKVK